MIEVSYTTLQKIHNGHEFLNAQMGVPVPDYPFLKEGKEAHRIIQDHVSGKAKHPLLKHIEIEFPVVEEKDFDERCRFEFEFKTLGQEFHLKDKYKIYGFIDGLDVDNGRFLEIKTSSTPWSMGKFKKAIQRKIYSLALRNYKEAYIITGRKDPEKWEKEPPKLYSMAITQKDRQDAISWIGEALQKLEAGDFSGGLDENGRCTGCFYNMARFSDIATCNFR